MDRTLGAVLIFAVMLAGCGGPSTVRDSGTQEVEFDEDNPLAGVPLDPQITQAQAEQVARSMMQGHLKDPYSANYQCAPMQRGFIESGRWGGETLAGWVLACMVNAKNSFGAYSGAKPYGFLFVNGRLRRVAEGSQGEFFASQRIIFDQ